MTNESIKILCPAKINWFLNVENSAHNGYHQLQTFMQKISLYDAIHIKFIDENILDFHDSNNKCFCRPEKNIIVRAALKLKKIFNIYSGISITLEKYIPVCAGLGGGSSNAASVLKVLVKMWEIKLSDDELSEIALSLGADVPFFLKTTAGFCKGIGEIITPVPSGNYNIVLWNPQKSLSTEAVYKQFDRNEREQKNADEFLAAYTLGNPLEFKDQIWNNLAFAAEELLPELIVMRQECLRNGAVASWVSGSGPTVISLCETKVKAEKLSLELKKKNPMDFIYVCETIDG